MNFWKTPCIARSKTKILLHKTYILVRDKQYMCQMAHFSMKKTAREKWSFTFCCVVAL